MPPSIPAKSRPLLAFGFTFESIENRHDTCLRLDEPGSNMIFHIQDLVMGEFSPTPEAVPFGIALGWKKHDLPPLGSV